MFKYPSDKPEHKLVYCIPTPFVYFTQDTVNYASSSGQLLVDVIAKFKKYGFYHKTNIAEMIRWGPDHFQSLDNRRIYCAKKANLTFVPGRVHEINDDVPADQAWRFRVTLKSNDFSGTRQATTYGEAAVYRSLTEESPDFPFFGSLKLPEVRGPKTPAPSAAAEGSARAAAAPMVASVPSEPSLASDPAPCDSQWRGMAERARLLASRSGVLAPGARKHHAFRSGAPEEWCVPVADVRFSQDSIRDAAALAALAQDFRYQHKSPPSTPPPHLVQWVGGKYTAVEGETVMAARMAGLQFLRSQVVGLDSPLPAAERNRISVDVSSKYYNGTKSAHTWGEAVVIRSVSQDSTTFPALGSPDAPAVAGMTSDVCQAQAAKCKASGLPVTVCGEALAACLAVIPKKAL